ncbi:MAG: GNAT family N-acetyltransferase [Pseudomonadota bacterium]
MTTVLRKVGERELHAISLVTEAADTPLPPFMGREATPSTSDLRNAIIAGRVWVLAVPGRIDGYLLAYARAREFVVEAMVVDRKAANQGVGDRLLTGAEFLARQQRCQRILLNITTRIEQVLSRNRHAGYAPLRDQAEREGLRDYWVKALKAH